MLVVFSVAIASSAINGPLAVECIGQIRSVIVA